VERLTKIRARWGGANFASTDRSRFLAYLPNNRLITDASRCICLPNSLVLILLHSLPKYTNNALAFTQVRCLLRRNNTSGVILHLHQFLCAQVYLYFSALICIHHWERKGQPSSIYPRILDVFTLALIQMVAHLLILTAMEWSMN